jgi:hypothetical protein
MSILRAAIRSVVTLGLHWYWWLPDVAADASGSWKPDDLELLNLQLLGRRLIYYITKFFLRE